MSFVNCFTELKIIFASAPTIRSYGVSGCSYDSEKNLSKYSYILLNGTTRFNYSKNGIVGRTADFFTTSYKLKGYFQCVIYDPERMRNPVFSTSSEFFAMRRK